jgi:ribosome assembly protein YihI (activator of Der GTPase)
MRCETLCESLAAVLTFGRMGERRLTAKEIAESARAEARTRKRVAEESRGRAVTGEEMEKAMAFVLEQQAQLTATVERLAEKVDRNADSVTALLALAEIHEREIRETDERLNALINTVERHISEGKNGK